MFRLSSVLFAFLYGAGAYFLIYRLIAKGDVFWTYLLNIVYIVIMLLLDYAAHQFAVRKADVLRTAIYTVTAQLAVPDRAKIVSLLSKTEYASKSGCCRVELQPHGIEVLHVYQ